ncbi:hypothetical protein IG197_01030 [Aminobacter sp. SR38]|jgi:hypothetical protein|uniref:hypothetical protein n=1 Tax=Aminobacter sp. SR38 TaxID=2774562 RepID=UPI00177E1B71|nr:hypothetical protein [Aminobacter sp. SR38]QOF71707.1 hypothetical protein IG197_01030 [Aminobacter sp. SR38]
MKNNSTLAVIAAALVFSSILLIAAGAMSNASAQGACKDLVCHAYRFVRDFQTFIAAGLAMGAAWYAGKPVWLQLQNMYAQHDIMARDVIATRLAGIERRLETTNEKATSICNNVWRTIYGNMWDEESYDPDSINPLWADDVERDVRDLCRTLEEYQHSKSDTALIEANRDILIDSCEKLIDCLSSISAPARYGGDPFLTEEQESGLEPAAAQARIDLPERADSLEKANRLLTASTEREMTKIKLRIRTIDDSVLAGNDL